MSTFGFPFTGPGSQPDGEDGSLEYMEMPDNMRVYSMPQIPERDEIDGVEAAIALLGEMKAAMDGFRIGEPARVFDLAGLDAANRRLIDQVLGEGEVSIIAGERVQAQESVLAGVWRVHVTGASGALERDFVEIGAFPDAVRDMAFAGARDRPSTDMEGLADGIVNAPPLLTELVDAIGRYRPGAAAHVINLSLLPQTDADIVFLDQRLGVGPVTILSRGYGNCRISTTATKNVWWVRYFNSREALILNSLEVVDVPDVACAAQEDIDDSAHRLGEILEVYR